MSTLSRTEAAREILERSFRFETKRLYAVGEGDETQLYFPETVLSTVELRDQFIDPQIGELCPPNQLCILVPDESDLEVDLSTYLTEDRGLSRETALENPALEDSTRSSKPNPGGPRRMSLPTRRCRAG